MCMYARNMRVNTYTVFIYIFYKQCVNVHFALFMLMCDLTFLCRSIVLKSYLQYLIDCILVE